MLSYHGVFRFCTNFEDVKRACHEFARIGKCSYQEKHGKCNYSHDSDVIAKFKEAETLGPDIIRKSARVMDSRGPVKRGNVHVTYNLDTKAPRQAFGHLSGSMRLVGRSVPEGATLDV